MSDMDPNKANTRGSERTIPKPTPTFKYERNLAKQECLCDDYYQKRSGTRSTSEKHLRYTLRLRDSRHACTTAGMGVGENTRLYLVLSRWVAVRGEVVFYRSDLDGSRIGGKFPDSRTQFPREEGEKMEGVNTKVDKASIRRRHASGTTNKGPTTFIFSKNVTCMQSMGFWRVKRGFLHAGAMGCQMFWEAGEEEAVYTGRRRREKKKLYTQGKLLEAERRQEKGGAIPRLGKEGKRKPYGALTLYGAPFQRTQKVMAGSSNTMSDMDPHKANTKADKKESGFRCRFRNQQGRGPSADHRVRVEPYGRGSREGDNVVEVKA
ncbi:hypothetical protein B0T20DRAFT_390669 [Sordaria brevicollis]|uniref:Uncharacterized protein n=1 Tax=Sordaria brevicollis TaxID=83679 RepID=A0AAE0PJ75_SORBR|nr:hypothetical protein B0T20DRAFT_390669 [Sordaria brevicollis]